MVTSVHQMYLIKVLAIEPSASDGAMTVYAELKNGNNIAVEHLRHDESLKVGDIRYAIEGRDRLELAPPGLWQAETYIGVIKHIDDDGILVDIDGRIKTIKRDSSHQLRIGNTVKLDERLEIISVVSEEPIRSIDLNTLDRVSIKQFKKSPKEKLDFSDFGGYMDIVEQAKELILLSINKFDELKEIGARVDRGILFYGLPGTGKTMLAQIIASQSGANFYHISGPEIISKWYGQSEELIRLIFEDAASGSGKSIIFFDEIDSIAAKRTENGHESSKRIVAQLLTCMDGLKGESNTFVIATTNRKQDIDDALLRPGRFDKKIEFPLPSMEDRLQILRAMSQRLKVSDDLSHEELARMTDGWTPADLEGLMTSAAHYAVIDGRKKISFEDCVLAFERLSKGSIT